MFKEMNSGSFKNVTYKLSAHKSYISKLADRS